MPELVVEPLFVGPQYQTQVWASREAQAKLEEYVRTKADVGVRYANSADHYARAGFAHYEGKDRPIRHKHEWGIYAIEPAKTLFRLYGFYSTANKTEFIIPSATLKRGNKMRAADKAEAEYASTIKTSGAWKKKES